MNEEILGLWKKIINDGIQAPSGDNSQPWKFALKDNVLEIICVPENDNPAYNLDQKGSLVAIGAMIENMVISATNLGYKLDIKLFPDHLDNNLVAKLHILKSEILTDSLFCHIHTRCTNRKPYKSVALSTEQQNRLSKEAAGFKSGEIKFVEDKDKIKLLAKAASINESVVLENYALHKYLFDHVRWTEQEEKSKRSGLYLPTLEFDPPTKFFFNLFKKWCIMNIVNKIGFAKLVASVNAKIYAQSATVGLIVLKNDTKEEYIEAGRALQRIWLTVDSLGLSLQMITGLLYFMQRIRAGKADGFFQTKHIRTIIENNKKIKNIFEVNNGTMVLMFRIGEGGRPSGRSSRREPIIQYNAT